MQVETLTEVKLFDINANLWHTPLTEEEAAELIAAEAAETEEFIQARIRSNTFDEAEELQRRQEEFEAAKEAAFQIEQEEQEQIKDSLLYPLCLAEVELEIEYATANNPNFPTLDNDSWDLEEYHFTPVTCEQCLFARQYFYCNPENKALVASPSISNHSLYYEPSDHSSDVPVVWLFDQLPYTSYHSEDDSATSSIPSSPAPSTSSIQSSVN